MKRICFITGVLSNGGAERVISVLAKKLSDVGYEVNIITIYGNKNDYIFDKEIKIFPIMNQSGNKVLKVFYRLIKIRRTIKAINPDVIISFAAIINIYTMMASVFLNIRMILSERNDPYQNPESKFIRNIRDNIYNFSDAIVFQTEDAKDYFSNSIQKKGSIISNPIKPNLPYWKGNDADKTIITACRLSKQKNLPLLINAYSHLVKEFPEYKLKIFGIGDLREDLLKLVNNLNLEDKVELPGFSTNIHEEMANAAMFVISSDYEGISNSMLEALAIGVPVISTDSPIGGAKMFIESNKNGILTKVGDMSELLDAMKRVLYDENYSNQLSEEAREIRKLLSQEKIVKEWINIIEEDSERVDDANAI